MRKLRYVLLCVYIVSVFVLFGCAKPQPLDACTSFLAYINAGNYQSAYALLHSSVRYDEAQRLRDEEAGRAQSEKRISEEQFITKYKSIFELLEIGGLQYEPVQAIGEGEVICVYDYTLTYQSTLVEFEPMAFRMTVRVEDGEWKVEWTPALMMPEMEWGDTVRVGHMSAVRGEILADGVAYSRSVNAVSICAVPDKICDAQGEDETDELYAQRKEDAYAQFARQFTRIFPDLKMETVRKQLDTTNELVILKQVYPDEYTEALKAELLALRGISIDTSNFGTLRDHPEGSSLAHIIGYVGPATPEEVVELNGTDTTEESDAPDATPIAPPEPTASPEPSGGSTQQMRMQPNRNTEGRTPPLEDDDTLDVSSERPTPSPTPAPEAEGSEGGEEEGLYSIYSIVGKSGLEKAYEKELRGTDGYFIYINTKTGENKKTLYRTPTTNGLDIRLTIDPDLQRMTEDLLKYSLFGNDTAGAVVVMDPKTGRVEAMASYPSFDLNTFTRGVSSEEWARLNDETQTNRPLYNRLTQGRYPPGSTFKPFTAAAGLNSGFISPETEFPEGRGETIDVDISPSGNKIESWRPSDTGAFGPWKYARITRAEFRNRRNPLNMHHGIIYSDNIYFSYIALKMGEAAFRSYVEPLGFTESIPFDRLSVAKPQLARENTVWTPMLLAASAYGQGEMLITPLQAACMFSAFANNGDIMEPHIVDGLYRAVGPTYEPVMVTEPTIWKKNAISQGTLSILEPMLEDVSVTGTAQWLDLKKEMRIASKTGTAQLGGNRDINWYVGFKMEGKPRLVCVMLEVPDNGVFNQAKFDIARELFRDAAAHDG